jgi:peptidoglycan hydrolase-like protein with peptidoglycan-binding domain
VATDDSSGEMSTPEAAAEAGGADARPGRRRLIVRGILTLAAAGAIVALAVGQVVATDGDDAQAAPVTSTSTTKATTSTTTTTIPPTTTTTIPPLTQYPTTVLPPVPGGAVNSGDRGPEIQAYELRLVQLHFDPGPVDGVFDAKTEYAAEAFDKIMGWPRDGVIDEAFVFALATFQYPTPLMPEAEADRVEIDLDKQVLTLYKGYQVALITTTSTGNGKRFCGGSDGCQYAVTPPGKFKFDWHVNGWREGDLGRLYNPWYFNGGIAVHGYSSVPVEPASHGCARIPMHISEYFGDLVYEDMTVYVIGAEAERTGSGGGGGGGSAPPPATTVTPVPTDTAPPEATPPTTVAPQATAPPTTKAPVTTPPTAPPTAPPTPPAT